MGTRTYSRRGVLTSLGRQREAQRAAATNLNKPTQPESAQKSSSEVGEEKTMQATASFADALRKRGVIVRETSPLGSAVRVESRLGKLTPEEEAQIKTLPQNKYTTNAAGQYKLDNPDEPTQMLVRAYMELEGMSFDEAVKTVQKEKAEDKAAQQAYAYIKTWQQKIKTSKNWQKVNDTLLPVADTFEQAIKQYDADRSVNIREIIKQAHPFLSEKQVNLLDQAARTRIKDNEQGTTTRPYATSDGYGRNDVYMSHKNDSYGYRNREWMKPWMEFIGDFAGVPQ